MSTKFPMNVCRMSVEYLTTMSDTSFVSHGISNLLLVLEFWYRTVDHVVFCLCYVDGFGIRQIRLVQKRT